MRKPDIAYLTNVHFGTGLVSIVPELLDGLGVGRPLIVTDPTLRKLGVVDRLGARAAAVFDEVATNPTEAEVDAALEQYRRESCDGIVAVGGGSSIDLAKGVRLLAHHPGPIERYAARGGAEPVTGRVPPMLAVPTTAGSGSEVGRATLITVRGGRKLGVIGPHMLPTAAICDPELTLTMPPGLTAATGMDAISHCVETFCSPLTNPVADAIALDGLSRGWGNIRAAISDPADLHARSEMMTAALEGGLTFQKGLGAIHSLSHALGSLPDARPHHGALNGLFLPHVLRFNFDFCPEKMAVMADRMGAGGPASLPDVFHEILVEFGLPTRLRDMAVPQDDLGRLAADAFDDHSTPTNPRPMDEAACGELLRAAW